MRLVFGPCTVTEIKLIQSVDAFQVLQKATLEIFIKGI